MTTDSEQTSQAVKAVIAEVRNRLPYFSDLVLDKPVYYDINRDYEPIFQQTSNVQCFFQFLNNKILRKFQQLHCF